MGIDTILIGKNAGKRELKNWKAYGVNTVRGEVSIFNALLNTPFCTFTSDFPLYIWQIHNTTFLLGFLKTGLNINTSILNSKAPYLDVLCKIYEWTDRGLKPWLKVMDSKLKLYA